MKISFNPTAVLQTLIQTANVISGKNTMPIFDNFLIETKGDYAVVTASDNEIWITSKVEMQSDVDFKFCINANSVIKALRNLSEGDVTISLDDQSHIATFNYNGGYFRIPYLDESFPALPAKANVGDENKYLIPQKQLFEDINSVSFAVGNDTLRPIINGVLFEFKSDGLTTVATDTYKLAIHKDPHVTNNGIGETQSFVLSAKTAIFLKNILCEDASVAVRFNENYIVVSCASFKLTARLLEGKYPRYNAIIPTSEDKSTVSLNKNELIAALKRVAPMGNATSELVKLKFDSNTLVISTEDTDLCTAAKESLECHLDGEPIEIGLKSSILLETLRFTPNEQINIGMREPTKASLVYNDSKDTWLALIMPMAI